MPTELDIQNRGSGPETCLKSSKGGRTEGQMSPGHHEQTTSGRTNRPKGAVIEAPGDQAALEIYQPLEVRTRKMPGGAQYWTFRPGFRTGNQPARNQKPDS
ncbi:hypothetical protein HNY73_013516 [Argiope bruennichi]|uniref:Uncharacterized protein n=1 Tax=Argiope bruennichi TaxID=94029 RepID=A0A8T0F4A9_ARGBR|nr:hypothetical protein HNY73_013516 [Argiope bruennichi]